MENLPEILELLETENYGRQFAYQDGRLNLIKKLEEYYKYPVEVNQVYTIIRLLHKHQISFKGFSRRKVSIFLFNNHHKDMHQIFMDNWWGSKPVKIPLEAKRVALREQKARGFIDRSDFKEYNPKYHHIVSNIDHNLIYPENFYLGYKIPEYEGMEEIYVSLSRYGVSGFTRAEINLKKK